MTEEGPIKTDFLVRQAKESSSPLRKNAPVMIVIAIVVAGIIFGGYCLVQYILNLPKTEALKNIQLQLQKPELRDGVAMVDLSITNYNAMLVKNVSFKFNIEGPDGGSVAGGTITIPDVVPIGATRTFRHVKLAPLGSQSEKMHAELVNLTLGPKRALSPDLEERFADAAAMKDEEAVKGFSEFVKAAPSFAPGFICLARSYLSAGDQGKAEEAARQALKLDPSEADAHYTLGLVLEHEHDKKGAGKEFVEALKLAPNDPDVQRSLQYLED